MGLGWWVVTFPGFGDSDSSNVANEDDWSAAGRWHVDGAHFRHFLDSKEVGLLPIFLFTDIGPRDGGTLLYQGSHKVVAQCLHGATKGMSGVELSKLTKKRCGIADYGIIQANASVVEVNGEAGDVMLCHPFMLHARSQNRGKYLQRSVRPMCHPAISLKEPMRVFPNAAENRSDDDERSPVEKSIIGAIQSHPIVHSRQP